MMSNYRLSDLVSQDELMHHGVKGQKWGRRRYQNKDGSLTPEGRKRYGTSESFDRVYPTEVNSRIGSVAKSTRESAKAMDEINKVETRRQSKKAKKINAAIDAEIKDRVSKMSDEDLKAAVNRINMEERYTQVMQNRAHIEVGESKVNTFLDRSATALTLASTGLTIALMIRELKK